MSKLTGVPIEPGIAIGEPVVIDKTLFQINNDNISKSNVWMEHKRLDDAIEISKRELIDIQDLREFSISLRDDAILEAQIMMLEDPYFLDNMRDVINLGKSAEYAVDQIKRTISSSFEGIQDAYLRTRKYDVLDLADRVIANLLNNPRVDLTNLDRDTILIAKELPPSITASLDQFYVKGIVLETGTKHSHTGIILTSKGIPTVFHVEDAIEQGKKATGPIILDGAEGTVNFSPTDLQISKYKHSYTKKVGKSDSSVFHLETDTWSKDHVLVNVHANVSTEESVKDAKKYKAKEIGLFRTEFLYMNRDTYPRESDENKVYASVVEAMNTVTFRILDIGGDKFLPYHPPEYKQEDNPALGTRGIRFLQENESVLRQQLRAIIRASRLGQIRIMVPMVNSLEEFLWIKQILKEECIHLRMTETDIPLGIMIETPAAALHVDTFAKHVDFLSIGSNDLTQFLLATDRTSPKYAHVSESFHPSIFRVIRNIVVSGKKHDIPVSICGALAQNLDAIPLLLGLGIRHLSVDPIKIVDVKERISQLNIKQLRRFRTLINQLETEDAVYESIRHLQL